MIFAQIDQEAMLKMTSELSPLEYQLWTVIKVEEFIGEGVCRLNIKEICEKYNFQNYDYLSVAAKHLRLMNWVLEADGGIVCQTDFAQTFPLPEEIRKSKKLRNSKSAAKKKTPLKNKVAEETEASDLEIQSSELRNSKLPTLKNKVTDLEIQSSHARAFKGTLNTQEVSKTEEEEEEKNASSASAQTNSFNFPAGEDSDESRRGKLPGKTGSAEVPKTGESRNGHSQPKSAKSFDDETRPDLSDEAFLEYLAERQENQGIDIQGLYIDMQKWCQKNRRTPLRQRFLNWLVVERKSKPMSLQISEVKTNGNGNSNNSATGFSGKQSSDAGIRSARRVANTNAAASELIRRGAARRTVSRSDDQTGSKNS